MKLNVQEKVSLKNYNSWRVGGEAEYLALPENLDQLREALLWAKENQKEITFIGSGSNILVSDRGIKGLVLCTKKLNQIEDLSDEATFRISCQAGVLKQKAMRAFLKKELSPALFLSGIPGDVAAGVVMNAGVSEKHISPKEFCEVVESFKVLRLKDHGGESGDQGEEFELRTFLKEEVEWNYRHSQGWQPGVITEVVLSWPLEASVKGLKEELKQARDLRASKQPLEFPSCGSVFTNPYQDPNNKEGRSAGYLIEQAGLKAYQYGGAEISRKHANFIINRGEAKALDIHCAVSLVKEKVKQMFGVSLQEEFKYVGDWEGIL